MRPGAPATPDGARGTRGAGRRSPPARRVLGLLVLTACTGSPPVVPHNEPPVVALDGPAALTLDRNDSTGGPYAAAVSDPDRDPLTLTWRLGPGCQPADPHVSLVMELPADTALVAVLDLVFTVPGVTWVAAEVTDGQATRVDSLQVVVGPYDNVPPEATLRVVPRTAHDPATIRLIGGAYDADGRITWVELRENGVVLLADPRAVDTSVVRGVGIWRYLLTVTDDRLGTADTLDSAVVYPRRNEPPVVTFHATPSGQIAPVAIHLVGTATDTDGSVTWYELLENSAVLMAGPAAIDTTVIRGIGSWQYYLRVTDDSGGVGVAGDTVRIYSAGPGRPGP